MDLEQVDIIRFQATQTIFTLLDHTGFGSQLINIEVVTCIVLTIEKELSFFYIPAQAKLGENLQIFTGNTLYGFSYDLFAEALAISRCSVDGRYSCFIRSTDRFYGIVPVCSSPHPSTDGPCSESDGR